MNLILTNAQPTPEEREIVDKAMGILDNIAQNITSIGSWYKGLGVMGRIIELVIFAVIATLVVLLLFRVMNHFITKRIKNKKDIQLRFLENIIRVGIIVVAVIWVLMSSEATSSIGKVLFQGTAIIGAVIGLAAQPIIADLFCGLMISIGKPFEIGDRIELDNGVAGIVMDITMRHVVLRKIDTIDYVIPNSKLNGMAITNMSHKTTIRSVYFQFPIAFGSDVNKAMGVIKKVVTDCPYAIEGKPNKEGKMEYGPVYFISYADSALMMATTVYYEPTVATEVLKSDINMRINTAFAENGIEIPFNYVNVVMK
ncbi:MAG: mechanosensitive ion channel family protein [Lachnospiraceae bacterium]|nr:mechanosensitive ion channel family protein [Lachnospiraceae bacterium]